MPSLLVSAYDNVDRTTYTTASISPTEGKIVIAWLVLRKGTATATTPTAAGNSLTWDLVTSTTAATLTTYMFRALATSPTAGTVVFTLDATTHIGASWQIVEYDGLDTSGTNGVNSVVQTATQANNSVTTQTVTLAAFADAKNLTVGAIGVGVNEAITGGTGFTPVAFVSGGSPVHAAQTQHKPVNDTSVDWSWTTAGFARSVAAELKASTNDFFVRNILSEGYTTDATGHTTSTVSVTSGRLYLISWFNRISGTAAEPTLSVSNGDTPVKIETQLLTNDDYRVTMFRWRSSSTADVTITSAYGQTAVTAGCDVGEVFGENTTGTNGSGAVTQFENNAQAFADPGVVTLASGVNSRSITYGAFIVNAAAASVAPTSGFTGHGETGLVESAMNLITVSKANSTTASVATGNVLYGGVAIELKRAPVEGSAAIVGSGAVSATGVRTRLGQAAVTGSGTVSSTGLRVRLGQAAITGSGAVSPTGAHIGIGQAAVSGAGTVTATGLRTRFGQVAVSGSGTISAAASIITGQGATITAAGSISATGVRTRLGSVAVTGSGSVSASGFKVTEAEAELDATGSLSASGVRVRAGAATLSGSGAVSATGSVGGNATMFGSGSISAAGTHIGVGQTAITGQGTISASGVRIRSGQAAITGTGSLSSSGIRIRSGQAAVSGAGSVAVSGTRVTVGLVTLTGTGSLTATGLRGIPGQATITATGVLVAAGVSLDPGDNIPGTVTVTVAETATTTATVTAVDSLESTVTYAATVASSIEGGT